MQFDRGWVLSSGDRSLAGPCQGICMGQGYNVTEGQPLTPRCLRLKEFCCHKRPPPSVQLRQAEACRARHNSSSSTVSYNAVPFISRAVVSTLIAIARPGHTMMSSAPATPTQMSGPDVPGLYSAERITLNIPSDGDGTRPAPVKYMSVCRCSTLSGPSPSGASPR